MNENNYANETIDVFLVYRKSQGSTDYDLIAVINNPEQRNYFDLGVETNAQYEYKVATFFNGKQSPLFFDKQEII